MAPSNLPCVALVGTTGMTAPSDEPVTKLKYAAAKVAALASLLSSKYVDRSEPPVALVPPV